MTQSLYQQIDKACRVGCVPIVKTPIGRYIAVAPFKDEYGDWRESHYSGTIEEAKQHIGELNGRNEEAWIHREQGGWHLVEIWRPQWEEFKVGDEVEHKEYGRGKVIGRNLVDSSYQVHIHGQVALRADDSQLKPALPDPKPSVSITINGKEYSVEEAIEALQAYKK